MSNQNKYTDSLPTQFKWHTWDDELNYDDKLTNLSFAFTTFDPIDDVYEVKKETMVIPVIKFGQIAYPTYDWQNVAQPTYDPVKGDIPRSILSSIESTQPLLDEFTRFKRAQRNDLTAAQKCQLLHDQRATKSPFRLDWRISNINQSQAYYFDNRIDAIDLNELCPRYAAFKAHYESEFPSSRPPPTIRGQTIAVKHPHFRTLLKRKLWRNAIFQLIYSLTDRHHPFQLISLDDVTVNVMRQKSPISDAIMIYIRPGTDTFYKLLNFGLWNDVPALKYMGNPFIFTCNSFKIAAPKLHVAAFGIPKQIVFQIGATSTISSSFRSQVKRLMVLDIIAQLVNNDYVISRVDTLRVLRTYLNVNMIKDYAKNHWSQAHLNESKSKENCDGNAHDNYEFSPRMINDIDALINDLKLKKEDVIFKTQKVIREWCINSVYALRHIKVYNPSWPEFIQNDKLNCILECLCPKQWALKKGFTFPHKTLVNGVAISVTPIVTQNIIPELLIGHPTIPFPIPKVQCAHTRIGIADLKMSPSREFIATCYQCTMCGQILPNHLSCACHFRLSWKSDQEKAVRAQKRSKKWNEAQLKRELKKIISTCCRKCGSFGHLTKDCNTGLVSCTNCWGPHAFSLQSFICPAVDTISDLIEIGSILLDWGMTIPSNKEEIIATYLNIIDTGAAQITTPILSDSSNHHDDEKADCEMTKQIDCAMHDLSFPSNTNSHQLNDSTICITKQKERPSKSRSRSRERHNNDDHNDDHKPLNVKRRGRRRRKPLILDDTTNAQSKKSDLDNDDDDDLVILK
eukprot:96453_1